jgi:RHS repeat-associated protein
MTATGSVRQLTNFTRVVTDTYDYDAFGNIVHQTGSTPNNYLFAGEAYDAAECVLQPRPLPEHEHGRFWSMDSYEGDDQDPLSLHKYLDAAGDPVDLSDPTGRTPSNFIYGQRVHDAIGENFLNQGGNRFYDDSVNVILGRPVPGGSIRPDLVDENTEEVHDLT